MARNGKTYLALRTLATVSSFICLIIIIHQVALPLASKLFPVLEPLAYDLAVYGAYPTQTYVSTGTSGPRTSRSRWNEDCDDDLILLSLSGPSVRHPGPVIVNSRGDLVWQSSELKTAWNLKMQRYQDQDYLTFWMGDKVGRSGKGKYFMLDSAYEIAHTISAVGDEVYGDLHEFKITPEGTALITIYNLTQNHRGAGRWAESWLIDGVFQEIDIATNRLLFEWRASDHFQPTDSYYFNPFAGYHSSIPYDFFHINSVDKDNSGNYLISSRHLHSIICIDPSGEVLWILGGKLNQFRDLSQGQATTFSWQHDARWVSEPNSTHAGVMTFFDNGKAGPLAIDAKYSQGLMIRLDVHNKTSTMLQSYKSAQGILSPSQGSVQTSSETGHVFVGWGAAAAYSEFSLDGSLLCETHFGASWLFTWEQVRSYRAVKVRGWHGRPQNDVDAIIEDQNVYASWNGATDVAFWTLEEFDGDPECPEEEKIWRTLDRKAKSGFEVKFGVPLAASSGYQYRVAALSADQRILRRSASLTYERLSVPHSLGILLIIFGIVVGCFVGANIGHWQFRILSYHILRRDKATYLP